MIRIKVYRASHLALGAAAALLAAAVITILLCMAFSGSGGADADAQSAAGEAAVAVFSRFASADKPLDLIPENEHSDEAVAQNRPRASGRVLIYHTHTHEAYEQVQSDPYEEISAWRTSDAEHSIVKVGAALKELMELYGFSVTHDTTDHEPPKLSTAYARSLATLEGYAEPFDLYIDLHRDEYAGEGSASLNADGQRFARLMMLVGKGEKFADKPDYEGNLRFARTLTDRLNALLPGLCRDVMVKTGRYNQHVGTPALLIEVGHNKNTLSEALASMPYLAEALAALFTDA